VDDVRIKLQYDRYYMENASFKLDFILVVRTVLLILGRKRTHNGSGKGKRKSAKKAQPAHSA
jgi:lipopolysaccharide/colanic/teichoic acid biosynthesis glycosyltransferase